MMCMVDMSLLPENLTGNRYQLLFNTVEKNPAFLCFANENYIMRMDYGMRIHAKGKSFSLMKMPKGKMQDIYNENFNMEFSLDTVLPELKSTLINKNLWSEPKLS